MLLIISKKGKGYHYMFDEKIHYKMYKSGKNWVFGAITTAIYLLELNMGAVTHTDNVQSSS